jgi:hypothetical protein
VHSSIKHEKEGHEEEGNMHTYPSPIPSHPIPSHRRGTINSTYIGSFERIIAQRHKIPVPWYGITDEKRDWAGKRWGKKE